ncbi:hypothetical protein [Amycolatopsis saalfeldensis]|uniref:Uncharacterized protein n=1 Tax=Amycolatopsis saalfeldensis TaxID=394193 RepID=A0A1H8YLK4_9PSEU|nr:hypothetical protein [Amycolatopsis saalfeldensis]SEP53039.1 hypothetical protein SAMN04489732_12410 [Amycolatopsis saalfeldensis]
MRMSEVLVRLYPPAIRRRWGGDLEREVALAGPRSWPDTVLGAAKLWLHPGDWPETAAGQTSRVVVTALAAVTVALALVLRAAGPIALTAAGDPAAGAWLLPIALGWAAAAPRPGPSPGRLTAVVARGLVPPILALSLLYLLAHAGPFGLPHPLLLGYYWATLVFAGVHLCLLVERIGRIAVMPSRRRLRLALLATGAGLACAAGQTLVTAVRAAVDAGALLLACGLALLAAAVLTVGRDLGPARRSA